MIDIDDPTLRQRLDAIDALVSWWQLTSHEQHVDIMRLFIDHEQMEATLADARAARADVTAA